MRLVFPGQALSLWLMLAASTNARGSDLAAELKELKARNRQLEEQVGRQQRALENLEKTVLELKEGPVRPDSGQLKDLLTKPFSAGNLVLSGEAGLAFFEQGSKGQFPNSEFRVEEAKLFLDAKVFEDVYAFVELNLTEREERDKWIYLGELYVDFENVLKHWEHKWLNVRAGRFDTPFGEEYLYRDAIDNPLISHSLSDIWGVDEGIEIYGNAGKFGYVAAVQNGGDPSQHDFDEAKAFIAKLSYRPTDWLYLSASGMTTGDNNTEDDKFSALWFGNGFFKQIGPAATTQSFRADLFEGDIKLTLARGHWLTAGGYVYATDSSGNERDIFYWFSEGVFDFTKKFYGAARFSQIRAEDGYPLVGGGNFGERMFGVLTDDLWRLSLGLGYHLSEQVLLKLEYSFNGGSTVRGESRDRENSLAAEIAVKF